MDALFCEREMSQYLENKRNSIVHEIDSYEKNRLLNTSVYDLTEYLFEKNCLEIPELIHDAITVSQDETLICVNENSPYVYYNESPQYINGIRIIVKIPFSGNSQFFSIKPSEFRLSLPHAYVGNQFIQLEFSGTRLSQDQVKNDIKQSIDSIEWFLNSLKKEANAFQSNLKQFIQSRIEGRRKRLLDADNLIAGLGFKIERDSSLPKTFSVPVKKTSICPISDNIEPYSPEPTLNMENYNQILSTLQNMSLVIERSPDAFMNSNEESIRTLFLVNLNAQFKGQATGETFNSIGKTDILIRVNDKNIFIGECKFWKGEKKYSETIDQILGYTSW